MNSRPLDEEALRKAMRAVYDACESGGGEAMTNEDPWTNAAWKQTRMPVHGIARSAGYWDELTAKIRAEARAHVLRRVQQQATDAGGDDAFLKSLGIQP